MNAKKCSERISGRFHSYQCSKSGKIERDGRWYCGTHDPVRIKEKREERDRKWSEGFRAQREDSEQRERDEAEQKRRADLFPELLDALESVMNSWRIICTAHGWDPLDLQEHRAAESAIAKARGDK